MRFTEHQSSKPDGATVINETAYSVVWHTCFASFFNPPNLYLWCSFQVMPRELCWNILLTHVLNQVTACLPDDLCHKQFHSNVGAAMQGIIAHD